MEKLEIPIELLKTSLPKEETNITLEINNIQRTLNSFRSKCTSCKLHCW